MAMNRNEVFTRSDPPSRQGEVHAGSSDNRVSLSLYWLKAHQPLAPTLGKAFRSREYLRAAHLTLASLSAYWIWIRSRMDKACHILKIEGIESATAAAFQIS
jgi:hypothetical protein